MNHDTPGAKAGKTSLFKNWISLAGGFIAISSLFSFLFLLALDFMAKEPSPYLGILTYLVAPGFLFLGLITVLAGWLINRRQLARAAKGLAPIHLYLDLALPRHRKFLGFALAIGALLLLISSVGSYQTYHATKSVQFCGTACHEVMEPQYVTYQHSPHAQVECTACHIAPGAKGFIKAKLGGLLQVYETVAGQVPRPIDGHDRVDIEQRTCEQCHWPAKFVGNLDRTYAHYLDDPSNTAYTVRLLLKVGGADPTHGPVGGIHWHMNVGNKVEYIATDPKRQNIPWIRVTDAKGVVTEYKTKSFTNDPATHAIQTMDCMDCHNRPAHQFRTPNDAVDLAMANGRISTNLPSIKRTAVIALGEKYETKEQGLKAIETALRAKYSTHPENATTIAAVQDIYSKYYFPAMKTDWSLHPNNIGHKDFPGCFRCHDGEHKSSSGKPMISSKDCNSCHTIVAEGRGDLTQLDTRGLTFKHPEEGWDALNCYDCHNGKIENK